jgi:hypothetical protein
MRRLSALALVFAGVLALSAQTPPKRADHWVATWATAPIARPPAAQIAASQVGSARGAAPSPALAPAAPAVAGAATRPAPRPPFFPNNQTLRQIVRVTLGGDRVRVVLSNVFGTTPLSIGAAHIALRQQDAAVVPGSDRTLTFAGASTATVPANAVLMSDPVALTVPNFADLAVDLYVPGDTSTGTVTVHPSAFKTSYVAGGDKAGSAAATDWTDATTNTSWYFLSRVEVAAPDKTPVVVTLGDSITDGTASMVNGNKR